MYNLEVNDINRYVKNRYLRSTLFLRIYLEKKHEQNNIEKVME